MRIACATDDGREFTKEHFGSAKYYLIYEYDFLERKMKFVGKVRNETGEEEKHGDEEKAKNVMEFMKGLNVRVVVGGAMGPNVVFIRKNFVPVISRIRKIEDAVKIMDMEEIKKEVEKPPGIERKIVYIRHSRQL